MEVMIFRHWRGIPTDWKWWFPNFRRGGGDLDKIQKNSSFSSGDLPSDNIFFVLARSQVNLLRYLTQESFVPTSMLCTRIRLTMRLGVTFTFLKFLALFDTATWRHFSHQLVWFSLAFTLDSFSRTARTRSHVQCWQLSSLGIDLNSDIHKLCKSII